MVEELLKKYAHWTIQNKLSNRIDSDCDSAPTVQPYQSKSWPN